MSSRLAEGLLPPIGTMVMDSVPPATPMSMAPDRMAWPN